MLTLLIATAIFSATCAARASEQGHAGQDLPKPPAEVVSEDKGKLVTLSYVDQARASFPEAKRRFLQGLPEGSELRVMANLKDSDGRPMNNLIVVDRIEDGWITGHCFEGMARGMVPDAKDIYTFPEEDVIDWVIKRPNGVIEGNFGWSPLVTLFALEQWGTGKACDLAEQAATSASWSEAERKCDALGARVCRTEGVWFPRPCEWDNDKQLYQVMGVRSYGCCV